MNESPNKHAVIVGLFIFIGLAFLLAGILIVGDLRETFSRKMQIYSLFDDVGGLQGGNNIWLSGVEIGTVSNLNFFGKSQVEVTMNIERKTQKYNALHNSGKELHDSHRINPDFLILCGNCAFLQKMEFHLAPHIWQHKDKAPHSRFANPGPWVYRFGLLSIH